MNILKRWSQIGLALAKYGFESLAQKFGMITGWRKDKTTHEKTWQERVRLLFQELGGAFLKVGQYLSLREDIFDEELIKQLSMLQEDNTPVDFNELKRQLDDKFNNWKIDEQPLNVGTIAQVHLAEFKGKKYILKILKPHIREQFAVDLMILKRIVNFLVEIKSNLKKLNLLVLIEEIEIFLERELDLNIELAFLEKFSQIFNKDLPQQGIEYDEIEFTINVPKTLKEYSNDKVLVLEYFPIFQTTSFELNSSNYRILLDIFFRPLIEQACFYADFHPGNIRIKDNKVYLVDFGEVNFLSKREVLVFFNLINALFENDEYMVTLTLLRFGKIKNKDIFLRKVSNLMQIYSKRIIEGFPVSKVIKQLLKIAAEHELYVSPSFLILAKALSQIEFLLLKVDSKINFVDLIKEYFTKNKYFLLLQRNTLFLQDLKFRSLYLLQRLENLTDDGLNININLKQEDIFKVFKDSFDKLSISIVTAALIISTAMFKSNDIAIIAFLASSVFGVYLLYKWFK